MPIPELLARLLTTPGPSGHESDPARVWREACATSRRRSAATRSVPRSPACPAPPAVRGSRSLGTSTRSGSTSPTSTTDGYLNFGQVGGWDPIVLIGQRVLLETRDGTLRGVIARKPIHLLKDEERKQVPELKDLHIDIGAKDGDEARALVRIGDVAVIDVEPLQIRHDLVVSRSLDNRMGCYIAAEAARLVAEAGGARGDVLALAVTQEETGLAGARTSAFRHKPDVAVVVDVTHATDQPGVQLGEMTEHKLGSGPVIARATSLHPRGVRAAPRHGRDRRAFRSPSSRSRAVPAPTPTRSSSAAPGSPPGLSRFRAATCTRRWRWSRSVTSTPPRG